jgi:hypothetical protein
MVRKCPPVYFCGVTVCILASLLPYSLDRIAWLDTVRIAWASAVLWIAAFLLVVLTTPGDGWKRWWPLATGPFALFPAAYILFVFALWKINGFAP